MSRKLTKMEVKWSRAKGYYTISKEYIEDGREIGISGERLYPVDGKLVHTSFGAGVPIAIYNDKEEMLRMLSYYNSEVLVVLVP